MSRYGSVVLSERLDFMILEVFSNLQDSMIWAPLRLLPAQPASANSWVQPKPLSQPHLTAQPQAPQDRNISAHPRHNEGGGELSAFLVETLALLVLPVISNPQEELGFY